MHPGSGLYLTTNHESESLEALKSLLSEPAFAGPRYQIVDDEGAVHFGPTATERATSESVEDLARIFGVPIVHPGEIGLGTDELEGEPTGKFDVGYTLEVIHEPDGSPIVSFSVNESQADQIMRELWPHVDFWAAPGGGSMQIETTAEADTISRVLGNCWIKCQAGRHRWLFHAHLV